MGTVDQALERLVRLEERLTSSDKALEVARHEIDRRLAEMNELRKQITDERNIYLTRNEFFPKYDAMSTVIYSLQKFQWTITGALVILQILIGLLLHFWGK